MEATKQINTFEAPKTVKRFKSDETRDRFLDKNFPERAPKERTPGFFIAHGVAGLGILGLKVTVYH